MVASMDLRNEHDGILHGLRILDEISVTLQSGLNADRKDIEDLVWFFSMFTEKCHHGKEEGLYFPAIRRHAGGGAELTDELLKEHAVGKGLLARMKKHSGSPELFKIAEEYSVLLRKHIRKENEELFPMGDALIPKEEQTELLEAFGKFEDEVMGEGTHEKLHLLLKELERKYVHRNIHVL